MDLHKLAAWIIGSGATEERIERFVRWWTERPESARRWAEEFAREQRAAVEKAKGGRASW